MLKPYAPREHSAMKEVLMDPDASGPEIHYYMIRGGRDKTNITVWETGTVGGEYIKTYGHYHVGELGETYRVIEGQGLVVLQRRKETAGGEPIDSEIEFFKLVKVEAGDSVHIPAGVGHLAINTGQTWFVTVDDSPVNFAEADGVSFPKHADYEPVKTMHGFAYYIVEKDGEPDLVKNTNYKIIPEAEWLTAEEYEKTT